MQKIALCALLSAVLVARAQAASEIRDSVLASGGGSTEATGHALVFTLGQSLVASGSSATHELSSGFWGESPHVSAVDDTPLFRDDRLLQNVPNPFNPTTSIRYELAPDCGRVRLDVYDVVGRRVVTLVDEPQTPGRHAVTWWGRDEKGSPVASGIYVYTLSTDRHFLAKKLILMK